MVIRSEGLLKALGKEMNLYHSLLLNSTVNFSPLNHPPSYQFCSLITVLSKLMALLGRRTRKHYTHAAADFPTFTSKRTLREINAATLI